MKAYKCDRCGKLFEEYKNQGTSNFFNVTRNPKFSSDCLDLCPDCNAELQVWVAKEQEHISRQAMHDEIIALMNSNYDKNYCMEILLDFVMSWPSVIPHSIMQEKEE